MVQLLRRTEFFIAGGNGDRRLLQVLPGLGLDPLLA